MKTTDYSYRIGEKNTATNGMTIQIVEYISSSNISVMFEDGVIVYNKNYVDFKKGMIGYPKKSKIGDTSVAHNGLKMKVISYRKYSDIDIEFEDGTIVEHITYGSFIKGEVAYPYYKRLGEVRFARNGMKLKIIQYRTAKDIDFEFEDGTLVKNRTYSEFVNQRIGYPKPCRIGETNRANNGMDMEIIKYNNSRNIDIRFADGTIVKNKEYKSFKEGRIANPNLILSHIGEENIASNGMKMKIVAYRSSKDIDIEFEDGIILKNRDYYSFCTSNIGYPSEDRVGEEKVSTNGKKMKIIAYRNSSDIDVQFEDGTIVEHKHYRHFKEGYIGYPRPNHIGEENVASNGMKMKIIAYRNVTDIDIEFEDGTIIEHRYYKNFKEGTVAYPANRLFNEKIANNGLKMKIIKYRSATDIDIEFEDGVVVKHKGYKEFRRGQIGHPYITVHRSLPEKIICYFIGTKYDYISCYKPDWLLHNKRIEVSNKSELDIYIPEKKVAIEYDGTRFHQDAKKDNQKSKSIFSNREYIELFIRIRENGCPNLRGYENMCTINTIPFSIYHKDSIVSLENVIKEIFKILGCSNNKVEITQDIIEYCRTEKFYKGEAMMMKSLGFM